MTLTYAVSLVIISAVAGYAIWLISSTTQQQRENETVSQVNFMNSYSQIVKDTVEKTVSTVAKELYGEREITQQPAPMEELLPWEIPDDEMTWDPTVDLEPNPLRPDISTGPATNGTNPLIPTEN